MAWSMQRLSSSRRRRPAVVGAAILIVTILTGCSGTPSPAGPPSSSRAASPAHLEGVQGRAVDLLPTVWHVRGAAGVGRGTYLLFTAGEVEVLEPKGFVLMGWATQGDAMLTQVDGWAESLGTKRAPTVPWLTSAAFFRRIDAGWVLLDEHGARVAELRDDGPAPTSKTTITTPQPVRAFDRARVADATAGAGARTPSRASFVGRWTVSGLDPEHALLTVEPSGTWKVEGGCDSGTGQDLGGSGAYRLLPHGSLLLTAGAVAGVGCTAPARRPPADTAALTRFAEARSLIVQHDRMTLFDRHGKRIGRLIRTK